MPTVEELSVAALQNIYLENKSRKKQWKLTEEALPNQDRLRYKQFFEFFLICIKKSGPKMAAIY